MTSFRTLMDRLKRASATPAVAPPKAVARTVKRASAASGERYMAQAHRHMATASKMLWRAKHAGRADAMRIHAPLDRALEMIEERE